MKCPVCRYNTLCFAGQLFNTHVTIWCPECGRLQVCERILALGVREFKRAAPSDPHTVYVGPPDSFQKGVKPFREVHFVFECEQRTYAGIRAATRETLHVEDDKAFGVFDYVKDPGPPQISNWGQQPVRSLEIKICVFCGNTKHAQRPISLRMLDTEKPPLEEKRIKDD